MSSEMPLLTDWEGVFNRLIWFFVLSGLMAALLGAMFAFTTVNELKANLGW